MRRNTAIGEVLSKPVTADHLATSEAALVLSGLRQELGTLFASPHRTPAHSAHPTETLHVPAKIEPADKPHPKTFSELPVRRTGPNGKVQLGLLASPFKAATMFKAARAKVAALPISASTRRVMQTWRGNDIFDATPKKRAIRTRLFAHLSMMEDIHLEFLQPGGMARVAPFSADSPTARKLTTAFVIEGDPGGIFS